METYIQNTILQQTERACPLSFKVKTLFFFLLCTKTYQDMNQISAQTFPSGT